MAAYAALISLVNTVHNIQTHSRLSNSIDNTQVESLHKMLDFLLDFLENRHSHGDNREAEFLETQIASVAHSAEDVIEFHIVDRIELLMPRSTTLEKRSRLMLDFLVNMMQIVENRPILLTSPDIVSLGGKLDFLLDFIENPDSHVGTKEAEAETSEDIAIIDQIRDRLESAEAEMNSDDEETSLSLCIDFYVFYMEQILNHPTLWTCLDSKEFGFDRQVVDLLPYLAEKEAEAEALESQTAECGIESGSTFNHGETSSTALIDLQREINAMKKKVIKVSKKMFRKKAAFAGSGNIFLPDLQKILQDMDSVKEKVIKLKEEESGFKDEKGFKDVPPKYSTPSLTTQKASVVGFENYSLQLLEWLTAPQSHQQIIPITGMGGIGKTTLARKVYDNLLVVQHFDVRAWLTLSQDYNVRELLFHALSGLGKSTDELENKTEDELGLVLHKFLYGRRYLIILDDIWSIECWYKISLYFPREEKRSRIVVTTRQLDVANHLGYLRLALDFLDDDESWDLFCKKAFEQGCCPGELENIGQKILKKCKGLPLSIVVIGGLLGKSSSTQQHWEKVEKDLSSILNTTQENQCFNLLSLSYTHLPVHLKPCNLYLGIFPEDHEIRVSRLIKLWVAEGFLNPNKTPSLEEVGRGYIEDLVGRNLLLVSGLSTTGKIKTCSIHDLLRDFCIKVAAKEKFFCLPRKFNSIGGECPLISLEEESRFSTLQSSIFLRSVISESPCQLSLKSRLVRVISNAYGGSIDNTAFQHVNLRFLEFHPSKFGPSFSGDLPSSISLLWNLQTLNIEKCGTEVDAPSEIWEMEQLRHLQFRQVFLPEPPLCDEQDRIVLRNLQTLRVAYLYKWSSEVCKRMPNIKKVRINCDDFLGELVDTLATSCLYNVGRLNKLESLHFHSAYVPIGLMQNLKFPSSLKKLCLSDCGVNWDDLRKIGSLPNLEVLKLEINSVIGPEWNPVEGEFLRLKYLRIYMCSDLITWNANSCHFPVLEKLMIGELSKLDEIPLGIGDIPTLEDIYLVNCNVSAVMSAVNLLKEQESLGNEDLQLRVQDWVESRREEIREKVELEGFSSRNFQLSKSLSSCVH